MLSKGGIRPTTRPVIRPMVKKSFSERVGVVEDAGRRGEPVTANQPPIKPAGYGFSCGPAGCRTFSIVDGAPLVKLPAPPPPPPVVSEKLEMFC